jgi:hypothetical protein
VRYFLSFAVVVVAVVGVIFLRPAGAEAPPAAELRTECAAFAVDVAVRADGGLTSSGLSLGTRGPERWKSQVGTLLPEGWEPVGGTSMAAGNVQYAYVLACQKVPAPDDSTDTGSTAPTRKPTERQ